MIIRNAGLNSTRSTLPRLSLDPQLARAARHQALDAFEPRQNVARQQPQTVAPARSRSGGFFSNLFKSIKRIAAGWLGQASSWLRTNMGGLIDKAKTAVGGLLTKAGTWFMGLLAGWKTKLES